MYKHFGLLKALLFSFILSISFSCQEEELLEDNSIEEINAAQQYFECEIDTESSTNTQRTHGKGLLRKDLLENLDWGNAFLKATTFGEAIYIPVQYDHDYYTPKGSTSVRLDQMSYVMMYKANGNSYKLEVVITLPDEEFLSNDKWFDEFTGEVIVEDWKGNFIRGYRYTDEGIMSTQLVDNTNNNSSQRLPDYEECIYISHYNCTAAYWEDEEGNLHYTNVNCEFSHQTEECTQGTGTSTYSWSTYELPSNLPAGPAPADHPDKDDKDNPPLELCDEDYVRVMVDGEYSCISMADLWEESICFDDGTFESNDCVMAIWNTLKNSNVAYNLLANFLGENPSSKLCFRLADLGETVNGNAQAYFMNNNLDHIVIRLNNQNLDRSMLSIARTLMHEMIHAEIYKTINDAGYRNLLEYYIANMNDPILAMWALMQENDYFDHEIMANYYVDQISNSLNELHPFLSSDGFIDYNNNNPSWSWDTYFTHLAFQGLAGTSKYDSFYSSTNKQNERNFYLQTETMETNDCQ